MKLPVQYFIIFSIQGGYAVLKHWVLSFVMGKIQNRVLWGGVSALQRLKVHFHFDRVKSFGRECCQSGAVSPTVL